MKEVEQKWGECLAEIRALLNDDEAFMRWFEPTKARAWRGNNLDLLVPSQFYRDLYEDHFFDVFSKAVHKVFGNATKITYTFPVVSGAKGSTVKIGGSTLMAKELDKKNVAKEKNHEEEPTQDQPTYIPRLNPALSFENYCVGPANKLPWTIAESIARKPFNSNFNPFFLYGDVGVGKTHLMQAIGLHVQNAFPDKRVVFLPMKEFQRLYQNAYLNKKIPAFLQWFMRCDVLLFDDLQEVVSSEGTLNNALFPIFNHLHQHGKQMVFTCDRPPQELKEIEDRLIDRFKWGITEKLHAPDPMLRKKILTFKARKNGLHLPADVIDYIAEAPLNSVREIEGIVLGIMTRAINLGLDINLELAREVMGNSVKTPAQKILNFDMIVEATADQYHLNSDVLFSKSRVKDVADARMTIMYLAQQLLGLSTGSIGLKLGRKHSTVIHGIRAIETRLASDRILSDTLSAIKSML